MRLRRALKTGGAVAAAGGAYTRFVRPWVLNWGATPDEAGRVMPGDEILPDATLQTTRVITVQAAPEHIWPWLVQMGPKPRAGAYTYDRIERWLGIAMESSDRILPEYQHLEVGEFLPLNEEGTNGVEVRMVEPGRFLVFQWKPADSTWAFGLYSEGDGTTRLVSRNRIHGSGLLFWLGMVGFMEPGSLVMERKMLLGIKERAESLARKGQAAAQK
jgi:hypothetical protein